MNRARRLSWVPIVLMVAACSPSGPLVSSKSPSPAASAALVSPSPAAVAPPREGAFLRTVSMTVPRADFAAVPVQSGKVLLIGGQISSTVATPTAEIFDPGGLTLAAAPMHVARMGHTATVLSSGKVLVLGGTSRPGGAALASAEIYDPQLNFWGNVAPMLQARTHHVAVLMPNGQVLVTGGQGGSGGNPQDIEVYDPDTNTWTAQAASARPAGPVALVLPDGRVFMYGGWGVGNPYTADFFDPNTHEWSYGRTMIPTLRDWATAALLPNGSVLIAGGQQSGAPDTALSTTNLYQPDIWSAGPAMRAPHCHSTMTTLESGLVLVAGGQCATSDPIAFTEIYDPRNPGRWWPAAPMEEPRAYQVAVALDDGRMLVAGGYRAGGDIANTMEVYSPS